MSNTFNHLIDSADFTANQVPNNPREATRDLYSLGDPISIGQLIKSEEFLSLKSDFDLAAEGENLSPIDLGIFHVIPEMFDLRESWIDYVDQRDRLAKPEYRKSTIEMALSFDPKHAGVPVLSVPKDAAKVDKHPFLLDWQKRTLALALRGVYRYPAVIVETTQDEMAKDFQSQFKLKDRMEEYDKFKASLAEGSAKHWAMQHCFTRIQVSAYPFSAPPQITGLGDINKAMFDPQLNPDEKNLSYEERRFSNFVRSVAIYRAVWPEESKKTIQGSWIRGMTAILASFDPNVLKGTDTWIIDILQEAKDPSYEIHFDKEGLPTGLITPVDWTTKKDWHGNKHHQKAIATFARVWNKIQSTKKWRRHLPRLDENPILGLEGDAKMLHMILAN